MCLPLLILDIQWNRNGCITRGGGEAEGEGEGEGEGVQRGHLKTKQIFECGVGCEVGDALT